jgi:NADH-quinone oxidoreductase subunit G
LKDSTETTKPDFFLIVGSNPRFEASTFNVRLRRLILQSNVNSTGNPNFKNIPLVYIGEPMDLTYPSHHIGKNLDDVFSLCEGKDT